MGIIYRPVRQNMTPNNVPIIQSEDNDFICIIDGVPCNAYRFLYYDESDTETATARIDLGTPILNDEELSITVSASTFTSAENYRWQVVLYANNVGVSSVDAGTDILTTSVPYNLNTGDIIYIQSTGSVPTGTSEFTKYYIRRFSSTTLALYLTSEAARSDGTKVDITGAGSGTITISNVAISEQIPFSVYSEPVLTLTGQTITSQDFIISPTYSHPEGVQVQQFDVTVRDQNGLIEVESLNNFTSNLDVELTGLISGNEINVSYTVLNTVGQEVEIIDVNFPISYTSAQVDIIPSVTNLPNESAIITEWTDAKVINGSISGSFSYEDDFIQSGNTALNLQGILTVNGLDISPEDTFAEVWKPNNHSTFDGTISRRSNSITGDYEIIGYEQSTNRFYRDVNGSVFYNPTKALVSGQVYLIVLTPTTLYTLDYTTV